jgi:uncharacterized protein
VLFGVFLHFRGHLLPPLLVCLMKAERITPLDAHGKEPVNLQISLLIYNAVAAVLCLVLIGFVFLAVLWMLNAFLVIIAAIKARDGEFHFPDDDPVHSVADARAASCSFLSAVSNAA